MRGAGLDHATTYYLRLETLNEKTHHVINANVESKRIPLVIDVDGTLRGAPVSGASDGASTTPQTDATHPEGAGKNIEFELSGTSGGTDSHSTNPGAVTLEQAA